MGEIIDTGLSPLPLTWIFARFGDCSETIMGHSPKGDTYNSHGEGTPLLNGPAEFNSRFPTAVQWTTSPTRLAQENDILFCVRGNTAGRMNIADQEYCIGRGLAAIRGLEDKTSTDFIFFVLEYLRPRIYALATAGGSTFPNISKSLLLDLGMPKPPFDEQNRIAYVLSTVQRAIAQQEQIIQTTTELKKALMHKLFTEGLHGEKQKETEIGLIPESWDVKRLDAITDDFQYGTSVKCDYNIDGMPVLRIPNVVGGHIDTDDLKFGNPKPNEIDKLPLQYGDLLFVRTNGVKENAGRCSMYREELGELCYYASYLIRVRLPQEILNPEFLEEYSRTEFGTSFLSGQAIRTADGKFNINSGTLKRMLVPKPDIKEQREIAKIASLLDSKIRLQKDKRSSLNDLFQTLLHQLMTAEIRVHDIELPGFDENLEPALQLTPVT